MTYAIFPVQNGIVIPGPGEYGGVAAGYSASSQAEARADVLARVPEATGTARCWVGALDQVGVGSVAGVELDAEVPR